MYISLFWIGVSTTLILETLAFSTFVIYKRYKEEEKIARNAARQRITDIQNWLRR